MYTKGAREKGWIMIWDTRKILLVVYENMLCSNSITFTEVDVILRTNIYRLRGKKVYNLEVSLGLQSWFYPVYLFSSGKWVCTLWCIRHMIVTAVGLPLLRQSWRCHFENGRWWGWIGVCVACGIGVELVHLYHLTVHLREGHRGHPPLLV